MATTSMQHTIATNYSQTISRPSVITNFMNWCVAQQPNRLLWLGIALTAHGCILTPVTIMAVMLAGTNLTLFIVAMTAMGMALVTNLAALPTKITIPVFFLSILVDLALIIASLVTGMSLSNTF
jgi:hypothetical protein